MNEYGNRSDQVLGWLLEPDPPEVRYLALRDLLDRPADDPELQHSHQAAHRGGSIPQILSYMDPTGFWAEPGPGYNPKYFSTVWSLVLLAQLGASIQMDERIQLACHYLLEHAVAAGGQFTASGAPSGTADCLQGNLCWALTELGCRDERLGKAFDWLARSVTGEGIAPMGERSAPLRYYAGKCGPNFACGANNGLPCAWGAVKVLLALANLPVEERSPLVERAIQQGVEFLFSVDPSTAGYPCGYSPKPSQSWWKFGFPVFYVTDVLQIAEVLVKFGYGQDAHLNNLIQLIHEKQNPDGTWSKEYDYSGKTWLDFGEKKKPNKYVTLRALRVLKAAD